MIGSQIQPMSSELCFREKVARVGGYRNFLTINCGLNTNCPKFRKLCGLCMGTANAWENDFRKCPIRITIFSE